MALDWHRAEEQDSFPDWKTLKKRLLQRFRLAKQGMICGQLQEMKQETTVEEYINLFDKLVAPFLQSDEVLENTFMNWLVPWVKADVKCWEPVGLINMMKVAQLLENWEIVRSKACLSPINNKKCQGSVNNPNTVESTVTKEIRPIGSYHNAREKTYCLL